MHRFRQFDETLDPLSVHKGRCLVPVVEARARSVMQVASLGNPDQMQVNLEGGVRARAQKRAEELLADEGKRFDRNLVGEMEASFVEAQ